MASYFESDDLKKFGDIGRVNKDLADKFFTYYGAVMEDGALTAREKALIALAVSHALKCPYCIDAYTTASLQKGADEAQLSEAVHVAATMSAGITLAHSVQMMNKVDEFSF
jgi:alkylhydroperoxidase/carboxymuconolactone decarboxylase family protein